MVRVNGSLTLIGALYLTLTLLSARDVNLFRNAVVTLPQLETGISLELSYLFAPIVFLYLHLQTLYLMAVLVRKVRTYNLVLAQTFDGSRKANTEYTGWLSAVSLVQGMLGGNTLAANARVLTWLGIVGIPLLLLFLMDVSFLRYQAPWISAIQHVCFSADLACVWIFWRQIATDSEQSRVDGLRRLVVVVRATGRPLAIALSVGLIAILWLFAWPKSYYHEFAEVVSSGQVEIGSSHRKYGEMRIPHFNLFDDVLCKVSPWRRSCRTLEVRGAMLVRLRGHGEPTSLPGVFYDDEVEYYRGIYGLQLEGRHLRYCDLEKAHLPAARLAGADLRGAKLLRAKLYGADLSDADLRSVNFRWAMLENADLVRSNLANADMRGGHIGGANLSDADMEGADLRTTELNNAVMRGSILIGADLFRAKLDHTDLSGAQLDNAELTRATLVKANLTGARMDGANVSGAVLEGANLRRASLRGATLFRARLHDANLSWAKLDKANLRAAELGNAELSEAELNDVDLRSAVLSSANLRKAELRNAELSLADLYDANLRDADLRGASLRETDLRGADLRDSDLRDADLRDADLRGADLRGADLGDADLRGANVSGARLHGVELKGADLRGAALPLEFDFNAE